MDLEFLQIVLPLAFVGVMLCLGLFVGGWMERSHFQRLDAREAENGDFYIAQVKTFPEAAADGRAPQMLIGEAVISSDYLKTFLASLRNIFGGEVKSYQALLTRARREALQRIVDQARAAGYNAVCNVRYENADVGGGTMTRSGMVMVAILASATAYHRGA